jgi:hypothetical protein
METNAKAADKAWAQRLLTETHWVAQQRLYLLVLLVVAVNVLGDGIALLAVNMPRLTVAQSQATVDSGARASVKPAAPLEGKAPANAARSTPPAASGGAAPPASSHWIWPLPIFLLAALATALAASPFVTFLTIGWYVRYREFENSLKCAALSAYLQRFWSKWLIDALNGMLPDTAEEPPEAGAPPLVSAMAPEWNALPPEAVTPPPEAVTPQQEATTPPPEAGAMDWRGEADKSHVLCDRLFAHIYHQQYGIVPFVPPYCILVAMVYAASAIVGWVYMCTSCGNAPADTCIFGLSVSGILAALGGAFLFVASDSVLAVRRRALNVSDIYWYSLRLLLAIPFALLAGALSSASQWATVLTFVIATLPLGEIVKQVRRMAAKNITALEIDNDPPDQLLNLSGVTKSVSQTLQVEGVDSIEQVAATDPVTLSIRTGFPFRFTLRLGSQAIVRRHLGDAAATLLPIGLGDVVPIYLLVQAMDSTVPPPFALPAGAVPLPQETELVIQNAAARLFPNDDSKQREAVTKMKFRQIAAEEYTLMLAKITPLDPAL